ncbi:HD domain-containing protein [Catenulispora sp. GAS73]|uniref:HD domain-containing protein n=1 Tax=Catenulispora sp. GAS73 TaxID=3156269 RepID=UPI00351951E6
MDQVTWACELAGRLLAEPLPRRWAHSQGVAARAESIAYVFGDDAGTLIAAAWLHDIGYAPTVADTGFHPLDGARYLRELGADPRICSLVAHHSCAAIEARNRGLADVLEAEFEPVGGVLSDALTFCDMTTTPDGKPTEVEDRLAEILSRYGDGHLVAESIREASPCIVDAAVKVTELIEAR